MPWGAIYGSAAGVVLVLALAMRPKERDAVAMAVMLLGFWAVSNLLHLATGTPTAAWVFPAIDLAGLVAVEVMRHRRPAGWKAVVSIAFTAQLVLHLVFLAGAARVAAYEIALNLLFLAQLLAVGWVGLRALLTLFFNWLLVSPRDHDTPLMVFVRRMLKEGLR